MNKFDKNNFRANEGGHQIYEPPNINAVLQILRLLVCTQFHCKDRNGQKL